MDVHDLEVEYIEADKFHQCEPFRQCKCDGTPVGGTQFLLKINLGDSPSQFGLKSFFLILTPPIIADAHLKHATGLDDDRIDRQQRVGVGVESLQPTLGRPRNVRPCRQLSSRHT